MPNYSRPLPDAAACQMMSQNAAVDVEVASVVTRALIGSGQWDKAVQLIQILQARGGAVRGGGHGQVRALGWLLGSRQAGA